MFNFYFILSIAFLVLTAWVIVLTLRIKKFQRIQTLLKEGEEVDLGRLINNFTEQEEKLRLSLEKLSREHYKVVEALRGAIQKTAVVRFDAFEDIGGKLSFAAAFLNENGDGLVVTAINGRNESRTYAKPVTKGSSIYNLSKEEEEAIDKAMKYKSETIN